MIDGRAGVIHAVARAPDAKVRLDGDDHEVVLRLTEDGTFGLGDAYHFQWDTGYRDVVAKRGAGTEELGADIVADKSHVHMAAVFDLRNEVAFHSIIIRDH